MTASRNYPYVTNGRLENIQGGSVLNRFFFEELTRKYVLFTGCLLRLRGFVVCALLVAFWFPAGAPRPAEQLELHSDETLFYVMAAINAAGYDEGIDPPDNNPLRKQVRDYLATQKIKVLPELKPFYRHHMQQTACRIFRSTSPGHSP